ncbi:hypothetical protein [Luteibaculum oceani]|uniref:Uncharacterized protein n=1 Tax=Luteibaculum oceani TaxID=1294296 RepID=A0A5C6V4U8_9FLAO|nr:hypothetical protein [Luteibaculum oceani]TXC78565.1 hypothetical protein FRX97_07555 [Luteibaculum oceani]
MKKLLLIAGLAVAFVGCQKDLKQAKNQLKAFNVENSSEVLGERFQETVEDITTDGAAAEQDMLWMHVAKASPSSELQGKVTSQFMLVDGSNLFVVRNYKGAEIKSSVDLIDLSDEVIPELISSITIKDWIIEAAYTETGSLNLMGNSEAGNAVIEIPFEGNLFSEKVSLRSLSSASLSDFNREEQTLSIGKENGEAISTAVNAFAGVSTGENSAKYKSMNLTIEIDKLKFVSQTAKSSNPGSISGTYQSINAGETYVLLTEANGDVNILQAEGSESYLKCKGKKKSKKKGNKGSKGSCEPEIEVEFDGCNDVTIVSSKDLSNVVLDFAPAGAGNEDVKLDNLIIGNLMSVTRTGDILGVWVKSGCNKSGDCPGCGEYFANDNTCSGLPDIGDGDDDDDDDNDNPPTGDCQCEGKMQNFTVRYEGPSGVNYQFKDRKTHLVVGDFTNIQNGDELTIVGFDFKGRLGPATKFYHNGQWIEIHTSCSENILGNTYGPFTVIAYTDGQGSVCEEDPVVVQKLTECTVKGADPGYAFFQAVWLDDFSLVNGILFDRGFRFEGGAGVFKELPDGKAVLYGEIYSPNYPNNRWDMTVYFAEKSTWAEWSAKGRTFKQGAGYVAGAHEDWTYYIIDTTKTSQMVGLGDNAGFISNITIRPSDYSMGFQIGEGGANDKNSAYGMAGWFWYEHPDGDLRKADWNLDVILCEEK